MRRYGVKVLWNDRKLWPIVPDLKDEDYFTCDEDDFNARQCEAARVVEGELGAGFSIFEQELRKFRGDMTCPLQLYANLRHPVRDCFSTYAETIHVEVWEIGLWRHHKVDMAVGSFLMRILR